MKICSACLLGINCKYDGGNSLNNKIIKLLKKEVLIPVCPEQLSGLPTPRERAEIRGGDGNDVLDGKAEVISETGKKLTKYFVRGAYEVLKIAKMLNVKEAILKQKSPSCGSGIIYDGSFSMKIKPGDGVTTALLKRYGIKVLSEDEISL